ncbi:hypothetical protein BaRGS_00022419 [Batillaria attramentaria]|uniref:Uncharacterized protein n=1 Tax=Batillaria attramentaria TaxID=370345 RepID=A0ABD0KGS7_9CAEN
MGGRNRNGAAESMFPAFKTNWSRTIFSFTIFAKDLNPVAWELDQKEKLPLPTTQTAEEATLKTILSTTADFTARAEKTKPPD